jgi:hypothetical protein
MPEHAAVPLSPCRDPLRRPVGHPDEAGLPSLVAIQQSTKGTAAVLIACCAISPSSLEVTTGDHCFAAVMIQ